MNSEIPKYIIHVWGSGERNLPPFSKASVANVKLLNPDFEYIFFDDERIQSFTKQYFSEYQNALNSYRLAIQRYDFFRYLAVYHYGGFYLDHDVFLTSGLSDLLDTGCVFPFEELTINHFLRQEYGMDWAIGTYAFGATPKHPFMHAIINNCVKALEDQKWAELMMRSIPRILRDQYHVINTTGPGLVTRTLAEYPDAANSVKVLFPEDVCNKNNWNLFGQQGIHLCMGSWREKPINVWQHFKRFIRGKRFMRLQSKLMVESRKRGPHRSL